MNFIADYSGTQITNEFPIRKYYLTSPIFEEDQSKPNHSDCLLENSLWKNDFSPI